MDIYSIEMECDKETMLTKLAGLLVNLGYAKESYPQALIERERQYPTGLALSDNLNVAIPHADIDHAIKQVLVIVRHKSGSFMFNRIQILPLLLIMLFCLSSPRRIDILSFYPISLNYLGARKGGR
jgi:PTS system galactitol-specific IIA component